VPFRDYIVLFILFSKHIDWSVFLAKQYPLIIFILTIGVFGIINNEMGVIGILPSIAEHFHISVSKA
jgi:hypothetical protein